MNISEILFQGINMTMSTHLFIHNLLVTDNNMGACLQDFLVIPEGTIQNY